MKRVLLLPYTFVLLNWAAVRALWCHLRWSDAERVWGGTSAPSRRPEPDAALPRAESSS